ncbi:MAG: tyrosine-type recombinase/integrase [Bacteroidetes bacterium]|nr:tyrosine-type recombinase/integrase [Bacteroidota bacterium]
MATIKFIIQSDSDTAGIYVRLKEGRLFDVKAKTKFIINSKDWSTTKGQPTLKTESLKALNGDLTAFKSDLLSHYNRTKNKLEVNTQWLKDFINPPQQVTETPDKLVLYYDYYALHKKGVLGATTFKKLNVYKHLVERFEKETKTEYLLKDVDSKFKLRFETFCTKEGYAPNTIAQSIKSIKTMCYHAQTNGIEVSNQLSNIAVKWQKVEKIYLDLNELKAIETATLPTDSLINAKDWLLISCETGQRVSDFMRFNKDQIRHEGGKTLIEFTQVKTNKIMTIPLSKKVMTILKKRKGEFPYPISDQKYNEYIKEVCKVAKLTHKVKGSIMNKETERKETGLFHKWELVTSHIGRRSFATNNYGRIPTSLLIGATGHSTEKMFLEYIGKTDTQKAMQLAEYF